jgi:hypothetical protein
MMGKTMHRIFVSGAMNPNGDGNHAIEYLANVRAGVAMANSLILSGFVPYCPMIDFQFFLGLYPGEEISVDAIRECAMSFVEHWAEAVLVLPGWEKSWGVRAEVDVAVRCNIPVFYNKIHLVDYFEADDLIYKH